MSVGEARAAEPLVRALGGALPDHRILMTCTTAAGRETIKQLYGESLFSAYLTNGLLVNSIRPCWFPPCNNRKSMVSQFRPKSVE